MNGPDDTAGETAAEEANKVVSLIATARKLIGEGKRIDLAALEGKVARLCESVKEAPSGDREELKSAIAAILDDLDRLETELRARIVEIGGIGDEETALKAADAYNKLRDKS